MKGPVLVNISKINNYDKMKETEYIKTQEFIQILKMRKPRPCVKVHNSSITTEGNWTPIPDSEN